METKICSKCKSEKPTTEFRWRNKSKGTLHSQCKECEKIRDKIHYKESALRRNSVITTALNQKNRNVEIVDEARSCGCKKCGDKRFYVLDFHHRNPEEKVNVIAHMIKSSSADNLIAELAKCDVLCANCHREFHYLNQETGIDYETWASSL